MGAKLYISPLKKYMGSVAPVESAPMVLVVGLAVTVKMVGLAASVVVMVGHGLSPP